MTQTLRVSLDYSE